MNHDRGQTSALCLSTTNAGGYLLFENTECDQNKTGPVSNSQNNDDWPSPQLGACDLADPNEPHTGATGTTSCTVWQHNYIHDNNNPNVPGNGTSGLAGGGPVGTGMILAGTSDTTLFDNTVTHNNAWGELIVDLPDQETGPANCQGGILVPIPMMTPVCYWSATGNVSLDNRFASNGSYGNPTNGDIGLATKPNNPGNCFSGDRDPVNGAPGSASTDPPAIESNPAYQPTNGLCTTPNAGDMGPTAPRSCLHRAPPSGQPSAPCLVCRTPAHSHRRPLLQPTTRGPPPCSRCTCQRPRRRCRTRASTSRPTRGAPSQCPTLPPSPRQPRRSVQPWWRWAAGPSPGGFAAGGVDRRSDSRNQASAGFSHPADLNGQVGRLTPIGLG